MSTANVLTASPQALLDTPTSVQIRPGYEGANIGVWLGFKHVDYLVEEAVLEHFRTCGFPARALYEEYGLGLDVTELDTRILTALCIDEVTTAHVAPVTAAPDAKLTFAVTLTVDRNGTQTKAVTSKARVTLRRDEHRPPASEIPDWLAACAVARIGGGKPDPRMVPPRHAPSARGRGSTGFDPVLEHLVAGRNAFGWRWRVPYFYCHFTERVQLSGYIRCMEEVVDLFLADRGISIKTLLDDRGWIPVVPHSRVRLLGEAHMEEDLYTILEVEDVFKDFTYTSRMDCYVVRGDELVQTATGSITHGYAAITHGPAGPSMRLVTLDDRVLRALHGTSASASSRVWATASRPSGTA